MSEENGLNIGSHPTKKGVNLVEAKQWLARPRDEVFKFFSDAHRLEDLTPSFLHFHVVTPSPIVMQSGTLIDYRLRVHGIPLRWRSKIEDWNPPFSFVDRQLIGPYRLWHHTHSFEEKHNGTLVSDHIEYAVPGGSIVNWLFVRHDLRKIFNYRQQQLNQFFKG